MSTITFLPSNTRRSSSFYMSKVGWGLLSGKRRSNHESASSFCSSIISRHRHRRQVYSTPASPTSTRIPPPFDANNCVRKMRNYGITGIMRVNKVRASAVRRSFASNRDTETRSRGPTPTTTGRMDDDLATTRTQPSIHGTDNYGPSHKTHSSAETATIPTTSDPPILTWVDDYLPQSFQPYARLSRMDKPVGTWLLLWPCYWSTAMAGIPSLVLAPSATTTAAAVSFPATVLTVADPSLLGIFTVGAFVMRGAGCTINDLWDQDYDRRVVRTATRPLANGDVTSHQAVQWLAVQLAAGLAVLVSLPHPQYTFVWGVASLPLVGMYPLMKRYTDYPQLVLGLTFNWGAWMGWAATYGTMDYAVIVPLYLSGVTWTMVYDTIYANQDKKDDAALGLKSTALTFGDDVTTHKRILHAFAAMTYVGWLLSGYNLSLLPAAAETIVEMAVGAAGPTMAASAHPAAAAAVAASNFSFVTYSAGVTAAYGHLMWQIQTADLDNPHNLAERFRSNTTVGAIVFLSILAGGTL